jgi:hypothetical protein
MLEEGLFNIQYQCPDVLSDNGTVGLLNVTNGTRDRAPCVKCPISRGMSQEVGTRFVELMGFEPMTSCLPGLSGPRRRATPLISLGALSESRLVIG